MASLARADLEALLHTKKLGRTLTRDVSSLRPDLELASTGHAGLDARLQGGIPRGHVSELVGPLDMLDVESAADAGIDLDRLLWIRGHVVANPGLCRDLNQRALVQAVRALTLVLEAGNFGLVVFDVGEAPADAIRRLPFTTWLRLHRMVEGRQTVCLLVGSDRLSRSPAGLTLHAPSLRRAM